MILYRILITKCEVSLLFRQKKYFYILITCLIIAAIVIASFLFVEKRLRPTLLLIAKKETQKIATMAINDAFYKNALNKINIDDLVIINEDKNKKITSV